MISSHAFLLLLCGAAQVSSAQVASTPSAPAVEGKSVAVQRFDPKRDADQDIAQAIAAARHAGKRVLLDFGGDWCPYCHEIDALFEQHADLRQLRDDRFIVVPVYYDSEHKRELLQSRFSKVLGIPHLFVLDSDGSLLHSQHVFDLRKDGSYSADYMRAFLEKWSKPATARLDVSARDSKARPDPTER